MSNLVKIINKLKDEQWTSIITSAWAHVKPKGLDVPAATTLAPVSSDFEIEDNDVRMDSEVEPAAETLSDDEMYGYY